MKLSNETYDDLKWFATVALPAFGTLIATVSTILNFPYGTIVVGIITAFATFIGSLLEKSSVEYQGDGTLLVDRTDPLKDTYSIVIDDYPSVLANKDKVMLMVKDAQEE